MSVHATLYEISMTFSCTAAAHTIHKHARAVPTVCATQTTCFQDETEQTRRDMAIVSVKKRRIQF